MTAATTLAIALFLTGTAATAAAFHHVVTGNGALEVQLIAAKLAVRSGDDTCAIISASDEKYVRNCRALMYGKDGGRASEDANVPSFASDGPAIGEELGRADGLILVCGGRAYDGVDAIMDNAPNLRHVAVLSEMGGRLGRMEESLRSRCDGAGVRFSVIRAGVLKGGGPGKVEGSEWGLSKFFYDTNLDYASVLTTTSFDTFTLGAKATPGDRKGPNFFQKIKAESSFEPSDVETGRTAAAQALLAAVKMDEGVDVSLSTEKAKAPPTPDEWVKILSQK